MHILFARAAAALLPFLVTFCQTDSTAAGGAGCSYAILGKSNAGATDFLSYVDGSDLGTCPSVNGSVTCTTQALQATITLGSDSTWSILDATSTFPLGVQTDSTRADGTTYRYLVATSTTSITPFYAKASSTSSAAAASTTSKSSGSSSSAASSVHVWHDAAQFAMGITLLVGAAAAPVVLL